MGAAGSVCERGQVWVGEKGRGFVGAPDFAAVMIMLMCQVYEWFDNLLIAKFFYWFFWKIG